MVLPKTTGLIPRVEFWSSTEGAAFQKALVRELCAAGCPAEERFAVAQSAYWTARTRGERLGLRARAYGGYPLELWRHFARPADNRVAVVCSNTFYAPWVAINSDRAPGRIIHWVFDLFPDVLLLDGWRGVRGPGEKILRGLMRQTFDRAAANVFLGDHLLRHAEAKFGPIPRTQVIAVGADGTPFRDADPRPTTGPLEMLYCGNLGRMHDVATLRDALPRLADAPWRLRLHGNGAGYEALQQKAATLPHVTFGPNLATDDWVPAMKAAQVALVTLKDGAGGLVMPSKTYSALVAGQAVLAVCPRESDLAELIRRHDAGWVIAPGDTAGLVALVKHILNHPEEVLEKRRKAWQAGHRYYEQRVIARRWRSLIQVVAAQM